jgi:hypothetical protein
MPGVLVFKTLSYGLVGILAITFLGLCLISMAKAAHAGEPLRGILRVGSGIAEFCVLVSCLAPTFESTRPYQSLFGRTGLQS